MDTPGSSGLRFTDDRAEYDRARERCENIAYTAALYLSAKVKPLSNQLRQLADSANEINVLNPISSYRRLKSIRNGLNACLADYKSQMQDCLSRLAQPVEGASALDIAWIQGFTATNGIVAIAELQSAHSSVAEVLDRKSAYAMACSSMYIAVMSLGATVILGVLSLC